MLMMQVSWWRQIQLKTGMCFEKSIETSTKVQIQKYLVYAV